MKKQLQIGFAVVVILLILESVRALAGTLDQIEIKIVTQDRSVEVVETVTSSPSRVSMQLQTPTNTLQTDKAQVSAFTIQPTPTGERPEILSSITPRITFTPFPAEKPVRKKTAAPENAGAAADSPTSTPSTSPAEDRESAPTSAPTGAPLPTSAPLTPPDGSPTEATDSLPTAAPTPAGP